MTAKKKPPKARKKDPKKEAKRLKRWKEDLKRRDFHDRFPFASNQ